MNRHLVALNLAFDRDPNSAKSAFVRAKKIEKSYAVRLRKVARHVADIVHGFNPEDFAGLTFVRAALNEYARILEPWAASVATRMLTEVAARDDQSWKAIAAKIGRALSVEVKTAPTGQAMRRLLDEQVDLITSLPREAATRVHELAQQGLVEGSRAKELAAKIMETGEVTKSRATLIARTETSRAASVLTQVRAQHIGSTQFVWRTAGDSDVRPSHRALNGKAFRWDEPPECDPGHHALPGQIWNCRCYAEPILPED